jgi:hypothetical protein
MSDTIVLGAGGPTKEPRFFATKLNSLIWYRTCV